MNTEGNIPKIKWRSKDERLACFDALIVLAHRGVISVETYQKTMDMILGRYTWTHELGRPEILRKEIEVDGNEQRTS